MAELTDAEIITRLATGIHGWEVFPLSRSGYSEHAGPKLIENVESNWVFFPHDSSGTRHASKIFNPLESWADVMELQDQILSGCNAEEYILRVYDGIVGGLTVVGTKRLYRSLLTATPRQRCMAMIAVLEASRG